MIKLINKFTGTEMYVAENRVQEYLDAGHQPAVKVVPAPPLPENITAPKKKAPAKKGTTKK